jgi:hypothetical protein
MHVLILRKEVRFPSLLLTGSIDNGMSKGNGYVILPASNHVKLAQARHFG